MERGGKVGNLSFAKKGRKLVRGKRERLVQLGLDGAQDGGFEAGKGEVEIRYLGVRKRVFKRIAGRSG